MDKFEQLVQKFLALDYTLSTLTWKQICNGSKTEHVCASFEYEGMENLEGKVRKAVVSLVSLIDHYGGRLLEPVIQGVLEQRLMTPCPLRLTIVQERDRYIYSIDAILEV